MAVYNYYYAEIDVPIYVYYEYPMVYYYEPQYITIYEDVPYYKYLVN